MRSLTVVSPGPMSTVQDLGRPGYGHLGIGMSGAVDRLDLELGNRLVGNDTDAAAIEATLGRLRVRVDFDGTVAVTGAPCGISVTGRPEQMYTPIGVQAGDEIRLAAPSVGVRTYLAVGGGVNAATVLGSRSTDTLSGLGPATLRSGTVLPIGEPTGLGCHMDPPNDIEPDPELAVLPGPRDDWFSPAAWRVLCGTRWTVTADSNRIGVRLAGPALVRINTDELPSEPMVVGALQVPPDGQPIIFLADHPVTGGYPVIGVVVDADIRQAAQLRPGRSVRFRRC